MIEGDAQAPDVAIGCVCRISSPSALAGIVVFAEGEVWGVVFGELGAILTCTRVDAAG